MDFSHLLQWPGAFFAVGYAVSLVGNAVWASNFLRDPELAQPLTAEKQAVLLARFRRVSVIFKTSILICFVACAFAKNGRSHFGADFAVYILVVILHSQIVFTVERRIRSIEASHRNVLSLTVRAMFAMTLMYGLYFAMAPAGGIGALWALASQEISNAARNAISVVLFPVLILIGMSTVTLFSPLMVRLMMPCRKITDPALLSMLEACFRKAGLAPPSFWTLEMKRHQMHNAMVSGSKWGRGPFRRALFITSDLTEKMNPAELEAIILHELSHLSLHHIRKRMLSSVVAVCIALPAAALISVIASIAFGSGGVIAGFATLIALFGIQIGFVRRVVRRQEMEADENAVKLGASIEALGGALNKLALLNGQETHRKDPNTWFSPGSAHPTVMERVAFVATAEDMIVTKLRWADAAHRSKDVDDIRNIIAVRGPELDWAYVNRWALEHATAGLLVDIQSSIPPA